MGKTIMIYRDDVWSGTGTIDEDCCIECSAVLGPTQDASDECYEEISEAISEEQVGSGRIIRPDGIYSWTIVGAEATED